MISHPYLHELFKACLLYDAEEVARMLCSYYPSWKLVNEWNIISVQQEFIAHKAFPEEDGPKFRKGDVVWLLAKVNVQGYLQKVAILHEVKTGNFDINQIFQKYKYYAVRSGCVAGGRTFLWI